MLYAKIIQYVDGSHRGKKKKIKLTNLTIYSKLKYAEKLIPLKISP